jgi:hypothetical protein
VVDAEAGEVGHQLAARETEIEQRGQEHVAGDARETIQVENFVRLRSAAPRCALGYASLARAG